MELLDSTEKLMEAESQVVKLQTSLDNIMKEQVQSVAGWGFFPLCFISDWLLTLVIFSKVWRLGPW